MRALILAITRSCPLRCAHCCEWQTLNQPEALSDRELVSIVERFQQRGAAQVFLSGGEPLQREEAVLKILQSSQPGSDFWLLTSGWALTAERALRLRAAGLTGVVVSLDHWNPRQHDRFRGRDGSFSWVERAGASACGAGLVLALALCPAPDLITDDGLLRYAELARRLGAAFIQIVEPRPVGRWADHDVGLSAAGLATLATFGRRVNQASPGAGLPLVIDPAAFQRRSACFGGGRRYVYVDAEGAVHPCAFCRGSAAHAFDPDLDRRLARLRRAPCAAGFAVEVRPA